MSAEDADKLRVSEPQGAGPLQSFLAATARQHGVWLVGGTLPLAASDAQHVRNATLFQLTMQPAGAIEQVVLIEGAAVKEQGLQFLQTGAVFLRQFQRVPAQ